MKRLEMTGRTVFLTGGGGGIGREILRCFAECGANVIAPRSAELDLLSEDAIRSYFEQLPASPDILIHAAGINILAGMTEVTPEVMQRVFQVNVFSFASLIRYTVPHMTAQDFGRIIGISSLYGIVSRERRIPYSASKHAMTGLIRSAALEGAPHNILVNGVAPGYVMTDMTRRNLSPEEIAQLTGQIPTGRLQEAEEIADLCLFLCSSMNRSITGQIIPVDGGFICK